MIAVFHTYRRSKVRIISANFTHFGCHLILESFTAAACRPGGKPLQQNAAIDALNVGVSAKRHGEFQFVDGGYTHLDRALS